MITLNMNGSRRVGDTIIHVGYPSVAREKAEPAEKGVSIFSFSYSPILPFLHSQVLRPALSVA